MNSSVRPKQVMAMLLYVTLLLFSPPMQLFAEPVGEATTFYLDRGSILINGDTVSGYDSDGNQITAANANGYIITQTDVGSQLQTSNTVTISGVNPEITVRNLNVRETAANRAQLKYINITGGSQAVTLENVTIRPVQEADYAGIIPLHVAVGAELALTLSGTNLLEAGKDSAAVNVPSGAAITIGSDGSGVLTARGGHSSYGHGGGAGIGGSAFERCGEVIINGGTINAIGTKGGAGIGGGWQFSVSGGATGNITINGGTVTATAVSGVGGHNAFGLGNANGETAPVIRLNGGYVNANSVQVTPIDGHGTPLYRVTAVLVAADGQFLRNVPVGYTGGGQAHTVTTNNDGALYFYLPQQTDKTIQVTVDGGVLEGTLDVAGNHTNTVYLAPEGLACICGSGSAALQVSADRNPLVLNEKLGKVSTQLYVFFEKDENCAYPLHQLTDVHYALPAGVTGSQAFISNGKLTVYSAYPADSIAVTVSATVNRTAYSQTIEIPVLRQDLGVQFDISQSSIYVFTLDSEMYVMHGGEGYLLPHNTPIEIIGETAHNYLYVYGFQAGDNLNITLNNVTFSGSGGFIGIDHSNVVLSLIGESSLTANFGGAFYVSPYVSVTLTGPGKLRLLGSGGIVLGHGGNFFLQGGQLEIAGKLAVYSHEYPGIVDISGGTISISDENVSSYYSYYDLYITGGSVKINSDNYTVTNGSDPVYETVVTLSGIGSPARISYINISGYNYGANDVYTDGQGNLYLWLPDSVNAANITVGTATASYAGRVSHGEAATLQRISDDDWSPPTRSTDAAVNGTRLAGAVTLRTETNSSGETTAIVTISEESLRLLERLLVGAAPRLEIPVLQEADFVRVSISGKIAAALADRGVVLALTSRKGAYVLPLQEIDIAALAKAMGADYANIRLEIHLTQSAAETVRTVERAVQAGGYRLSAPPVKFTVVCIFGDKTVEVNRFNSYVMRAIAIPEGVDPAEITTAVVVGYDGALRHVPTRITAVGGRYYAEIRSRSNSTYALIWHGMEFADTEKHWARKDIADMSSRLIIGGVGNQLFAPNRGITRAEFASMLVRALGLQPVTATNPFSDVAETAWYRDVVLTAYGHQLIAGYGDGRFGPAEIITREQAAAILYNALTLTHPDAEPASNGQSNVLTAFSDYSETADYAKEALTATVRLGIIGGRGNLTLAPKGMVTRAEAATMVRRMLSKAGLI